jgi:hypothetical protein
MTSGTSILAGGIPPYGAAASDQTPFDLAPNCELSSGLYHAVYSVELSSFARLISAEMNHVLLGRSLASASRQQSNR